MSQTVVTNGDDASPGRVITPEAVYRFNLNAAKERLNDVLKLLKELDNKDPATVTWADTSRLDFVNTSLLGVTNHYR